MPLKELPPPKRLVCQCGCDRIVGFVQRQEMGRRAGKWFRKPYSVPFCQRCLQRVMQEFF